MKELFNRHQERLTDAEDRKVWQATYDAAKGRRPFWKRWGVPVSALATATAAVVVVAVVNQGESPMVRDELAQSVPPLTEDRPLPLSKGIEGNRQDADLESKVKDGRSTETPEVATLSSIMERDEFAQRMVLPEEAELENQGPAAGLEARRPQNRLETQPVEMDMLAANEPAERANKKSVTAKEVSAIGNSIRGRVTTEKGEPLSFANVVILGTNHGAMTDTSGAFLIEGVPLGSYAMKISYLGYEAVQQDVQVQGEVNFAQNFEMSEAEVAESDNTVVVAARDVIRRGGRTEELAQRIDNYKSESKDSEGREQGKKPRSRALRENLSKGKSDGNAPSVVAADELSSGGAALSTPAPKKPVWGGMKRTFGAQEPGPATTVGGSHAVNGKIFDDMFFEHYGVNPFVDPEDDRFSTFAVDVDNASYSLTRSYLQRGVLPPREAVRVEEFINSFKHNYAPPQHPLMARGDRWAESEKGTFAIHLDAAPSPFGDDLLLVRVGLKGRDIYEENRKPANLTFVIDVSGSMGREDRLGLVKQSLFLLVDQMTDEDQVSLVVYGSNARTVLNPTSLRNRSTIERAIAQLKPEGATNAEAGLRMGYRLAEKTYRQGCINRVILCSDGVANVGQTGADPILSVIKQQAGEGIYLTAVGFGMGNYNDVLMEKLADKGEGNYYYVDQLDEARKVFVENLTGTLQTIARQMKTQVEFDPNTVRRYRLIGYENRDVADKDFRNNKVDAGEVGAGHEVTALFELKLEKDAPRHGNLATVRIRYEDPDTKRVTEESRVLRTEDIERRFSRTDPTFRMDAAVAEFAEILRHSYWSKDGDLSKVLGLARNTSRELGHPQELEEMVQLVQQAWNLWPKQDSGEWKVRPTWDPDEDGDD